MYYDNDRKKYYYRILAIADIHFGVTKDDDHLYKELDEIFLNYIREDCNSIDMIVICGDLADREINMNEKSGKLLTRFVLELENLCYEKKIKLIIIKGTMSHDYNQLENFRNLEIIHPSTFKIINKVEILEVNTSRNNKLKMLFIPEEYIEDPNSYYSPFLDKNTSLYDFIFVHGTFDFAGYVSKLSNTDRSERPIKGSPTFSSAKFRDIAYGCTIAGHVHTCMNNNNVYYCGSFSRFAFNETEEKGFFDILYNPNDNEDMSISFIENNLAPTYITISYDELPKDLEKKTRYIKQLKKKYDYVRIKTVMNEIDSKADLKILKEFSNMDNMVKMDITNDTNEDENHEYDFILNRECNDMAETITKFQEVKNDNKVDEDKVRDQLNKLLSENA